jgi:hypothetical protein
MPDRLTHDARSWPAACVVGQQNDVEGEDSAMATKDWAKGRDDETGPGPDLKAARPNQEGNPARGKPNELKADETHRARQTPKNWKANRIDAGEARKNAR